MDCKLDLMQPKEIQIILDKMQQVRMEVAVYLLTTTRIKFELD